VIEPDLALERSLSPASGWAGDEIVCNLKISHPASSTAPAYDVSLRDALPEGMEYVPGSLELISGPPGLADAAGPAWSFPEIDGSRTFSADISAQVYVPGEFASSAGSDWPPPACFDLNCTAMGGAENWIPCTACSAAGLEDIETECSSCSQVEE